MATAEEGKLQELLFCLQTKGTSLASKDVPVLRPCVLLDQPDAHTAKRPKYVYVPNAHVQLNIDLHGVSLRLESSCNYSLLIVS